MFQGNTLLHRAATATIKKTGEGAKDGKEGKEGKDDKDDKEGTWVKDGQEVDNGADGDRDSDKDKRYRVGAFLLNGGFVENINAKNAKVSRRVSTSVCTCALSFFLFYAFSRSSKFSPHATVHLSLADDGIFALFLLLLFRT